MAPSEPYAKLFNKWLSWGLLSAFGLAVSASGAFASVHLPEAPVQAEEDVATRLAAIRSAVSRASSTSLQEARPASPELAQWGNWGNWGNYFNNWAKPWYNFNNWGNF